MQTKKQLYVIINGDNSVETHMHRRTESEEAHINDNYTYNKKISLNNA